MNGFDSFFSIKNYPEYQEFNVLMISDLFSLLLQVYIHTCIYIHTYMYMCLYTYFNEIEFHRYLVHRYEDNHPQ